MEEEANDGKACMAPNVKCCRMVLIKEMMRKRERERGRRRRKRRERGRRERGRRRGEGGME